jgi:hypothetical protein
MNPLIVPVAKAVEAISVWLNPERKEKIILRRAIESAEQLLMVLRKQGRYAKFTDAKLAEYEIHYQKQFNAWRDGTG